MKRPLLVASLVLACSSAPDAELYATGSVGGETVLIAIPDQIPVAAPNLIVEAAPVIVDPFDAGSPRGGSAGQNFGGTSGFTNSEPDGGYNGGKVTGGFAGFDSGSVDVGGSGGTPNQGGNGGDSNQGGSGLVAGQGSGGIPDQGGAGSGGVPEVGGSGGIPPEGGAGTVGTGGFGAGGTGGMGGGTGGLGGGTGGNSGAGGSAGSGGEPDVDAGPVGCPTSVVTGSVTVTDQEAFDALEGVTEITGELYIFGTRLFDLTGLECLESVDALRISDNNSMQYLTGLENLNHVERDIVIWNNQRLKDLFGLEKITRLNLGQLRLSTNAILHDVSGLKNLTYIYGALGIWENPRLASCEAAALANQLGKVCTATPVAITCTGICNCTGNQGVCD